MDDYTQNFNLLAISFKYNTLTRKLLKTFTVDRGKEFVCYEQFETKFAEQQRDSNENSNDLLREFFPKKIDLAKVTLDKLTEALMLTNNRPRKCLGFKIPFDMLNMRLEKLI